MRVNDAKKMGSIGGSQIQKQKTMLKKRISADFGSMIVSNKILELKGDTSPMPN